MSNDEKLLLLSMTVIFFLFFFLVSHPIRPKAPSATSIPAILKSLQDEWVSSLSRDMVATIKHLHTVNVTQNLCFEITCMVNFLSKAIFTFLF